MASPNGAALDSKKTVELRTFTQIRLCLVGSGHRGWGGGGGGRLVAQGLCTREGVECVDSSRCEACIRGNLSEYPGGNASENEKACRENRDGGMNE